MGNCCFKVAKTTKSRKIKGQHQKPGKTPSRTQAHWKLKRVDPNMVPCFPWVNQVIECYVYQVYDGDTVKVLIDYNDVLFNLSVRLLGIDTPEIRRHADDADGKEKQAGLVVRNHLKGLLEGRVAKLYATGWDKYGGRMDGHIWLTHFGRDSDENMSDHLIKLGYAKRYDASADSKPVWTESELDEILTSK